jgi:hypothetical protein
MTPNRPSQVDPARRRERMSEHGVGADVIGGGGGGGGGGFK